MSSRQRVITDTNKAPLVQVLALMFLVIAVLACFVRTTTKIYMVKALKTDDVLVIVSTAFAIAQSVAIFVSCENGLGKPFDMLEDAEKDIFFESFYAANLLFIASLLFSKLSGVLSIRIMSRRSQKWLVVGFEAITGIWGISALLVVAFQCQIPSPWNYSDTSKCVNIGAFWMYYSIANIVTDLAIVGVMTDNIRRIQTSWAKKTLVIVVFGSRVLVIPAAAAQVVYSNKAFSSPDLSFSMWETTITAQLVQFLAIFTVCVPNLKPFLDSLESGQIRIDDLRRQGKTSSNGYPSYRLGRYAGKAGTSSGNGSRSRTNKSVDMVASATSQHSNVHEMVDIPRSKMRQGGGVNGEQKKSWDEQSHRSHSSQTILIRQTWQVDVQDVSQPASS